MYETVSSDEAMHTQLGDSNVRVTVDFVIVPYAHLPIPMLGSVTLVGEAMGYQVAWPKNLVLVDDEAMPKHLPKQNKLRTKSDLPHPKPNPKGKKRKQCKLAMGSIENIVAHGRMYERVSSDETIHTLPLGDLNVRVYVDFVIIPHALLPIPIPGDETSVGEVMGYELAWPKNLVFVNDEGASKHLPKQANKRAPEHVQVSANEATSKNVDSDKYLESIQLFASYAMIMEYEDTMLIILEKGIFGVELEFSLTREDMEFICQFKELSISCIMLYISYLHVAMKETNLDTRFLFINPSIISGKFKAGEVSKATMLSNRLQEAKAGQLVFVPYNLEYHWMLAVIDLSSAIIYYFDSIYSKINVNLQLIIETALKIYDSSKGNRRRNPSWKVIKCPKQPTEVECRFYVMRFMKDVIKDPSILSNRDGSFIHSVGSGVVARVVDWNASCFNVTPVLVDSQCITTRVEQLQSSVYFYISVVYGANSVPDRILLWGVLRSLYGIIGEILTLAFYVFVSVHMPDGAMFSGPIDEDHVG
ncbi:uncharacterized protein LOC131302926 [Rhododendron vialii]|uniref:uncharacterized protein LOC131302926 n=1 Tax=Rhododendron vialii TaxID=182163 RepID=UPI00265E3851|nr:uncharacterized protein LOC131302926 [Rhododendron vialii]